MYEFTARRAVDPKRGGLKGAAGRLLNWNRMIDTNEHRRRTRARFFWHATSSGIVFYRMFSSYTSLYERVLTGVSCMQAYKVGVTLNSEK